MLRSVLAVLSLTLLAGVAGAELRDPWVLVRESSDGDKYYIDTQSIRREGSRVTWWEIVTNARPQDGAVSAQGQFLGDCKKMKIAVIQGSAFSGADAQGDRLYEFGQSISEAARQLEKVVPESRGETILQFVCARSQ